MNPQPGQPYNNITSLFDLSVLRNPHIGVVLISD